MSEQHVTSTGKLFWHTLYPQRNGINVLDINQHFDLLSNVRFLQKSNTRNRFVMSLYTEFCPSCNETPKDTMLSHKKWYEAFSRNNDLIEGSNVPTMSSFVNYCIVCTKVLLLCIEDRALFKIKIRIIKTRFRACVMFRPWFFQSNSISFFIYCQSAKNLLLWLLL